MKYAGKLLLLKLKTWQPCLTVWKKQKNTLKECRTERRKHWISCNLKVQMTRQSIFVLVGSRWLTGTETFMEITKVLHIVGPSFYCLPRQCLDTQVKYSCLHHSSLFKFTFQSLRSILLGVCVCRHQKSHLYLPYKLI